MIFASPSALFLLVPWIVAAAWVLLATQDLAYVPFSRLWPKSEPVAAARHAPRRPPVWVILLLAAALLAIFAAAELSLAGGGRSLTVVVDCGLSMSPAGRVASAADLSAGDVVRVIPVPGEPFTAVGRGAFDHLMFTAADTARVLDRAVRSALASENGQVAVISDHPPAVDDSRVIWLPPKTELRNAAIVRFAVVELISTAVPATATVGTGPATTSTSAPATVPTTTASSTGQAMVRVFNGTAQRIALLQVDAVEQPIELPPTGQTRDYFVELPALGDVIEARLHIDDDIAADNRAYLARATAWPRVEASTALPVALQRLLAIYALQRPPSDASRQVTVATSPPLDRTFTAAWLAQAGAVVPVANAALQCEDHAVTASIDWPKLARSANAQPLPPGGWRPLVRAGDNVLVAIREKPARQIWIGFDISQFDREPNFVIFWTNVFDWLGGGLQQFVAEAASTTAADWKPLRQADAAIAASPGVYQRGDGSRVALSYAAPTPSESFKRVHQVMHLNPAAKPLAAQLLAASLLLLATALTLARRLT